MDRFDQYRVFAQVAAMGSFIKAAHALDAPRASVSAAIQQLESSLGTRLFHRTTRQTQLTADGIQLLEHIRPIVTDVEELEAQFRDRRSRVSGRLSIDAPSRIVRRLLVPQLSHFLARHPQLEVFLGSSDRFVDLVQEALQRLERPGEELQSLFQARQAGGELLRPARGRTGERRRRCDDDAEQGEDEDEGADRAGQMDALHQPHAGLEQRLQQRFQPVPRNLHPDTQQDERNHPQDSVRRRGRNLPRKLWRIGVADVYQNA